MGIITRVLASEGNCVYEMKVLKADSVNKFAINAVAGELLPRIMKKRTLPQANPSVQAARTWAAEVMAREEGPEKLALWNPSNSHLL
jgi:hypothetical protein